MSEFIVIATTVAKPGNVAHLQAHTQADHFAAGMAAIAGLTVEVVIEELVREDWSPETALSDRSGH